MEIMKLNALNVSIETAIPSYGIKRMYVQVRIRGYKNVSFK